MGYYIEVPDNKNKAQQLVDLYGAERIDMLPDSLAELPEDKALICVVQNPMYDAAALAYSDREMRYFASQDHDYGPTGIEISSSLEEAFRPRPLAKTQRPRTWLLMDKITAYKLSGYKEEGK